MKKCLLPLTFLVTLFLSSPPALAAGQHAWTFGYKGKFALASVDSQVDSCTWRSAFIVAGEQVIRQGGRPVSGAGVTVNFWEWNDCTQTFSYGYGDAILGSGDFGFSSGSGLDSGWAKKTVNVCQYDGYDQLIGCSDVLVDLAWKGAGPIFDYSGAYRFGERKSWKVSGHDKSSTRNASVTGTVTCGDVDYLDGASVWGNLGNSSGGSVSISH
jgi:hypothetical protein